MNKISFSSIPHENVPHFVSFFIPHSLVTMPTLVSHRNFHTFNYLRCISFVALPILEMLLSEKYDEEDAILSSQVHIDDRDLSGHTSLHLAVTQSNLPIAMLLLNRGANIDAPDNEGRTALHWAAEQGNLEIATLLVANNAKLESTEINGETALHRSSAGGHLSVVTYLIDSGANIEASDSKYGQTALHKAASHGRLSVVEALVNRLANIDSISHAGWTPTHHACKCGALSVASFLLDKGAKMDVVGHFGKTPLAVAVEKGHIQVASLLIERGADVTVVNKDGVTPFALLRQEAKAKILLERNFSVESIVARDRNLWFQIALGLQDTENVMPSILNVLDKCQKEYIEGDGDLAIITATDKIKSIQSRMRCSVDRSTSPLADLSPSPTTNALLSAKDDEIRDLKLQLADEREKGIKLYNKMEMIAAREKIVKREIKLLLDRINNDSDADIT